VGKFTRLHAASESARTPPLPSTGAGGKDFRSIASGKNLASRPRLKPAPFDRTYSCSLTVLRNQSRVDERRHHVSGGHLWRKAASVQRIIGHAVTSSVEGSKVGEHTVTMREPRVIAT